MLLERESGRCEGSLREEGLRDRSCVVPRVESNVCVLRTVDNIVKEQGQERIEAVRYCDPSKLAGVSSICRVLRMAVTARVDK